MVEQKVILIGCKKVDFSQQGSEPVQGTQVFYHQVDPENTQEVKGFIPSKAWLPLDHFATYANANYPTPAIGQFDVDLSKGKLKLKAFKSIGVK